LRLELWTLKGTFAGDFETAELIQGMLKAVGVEARMNVAEAATFIQRVTRPPDQADYDLVNLNVGTFTGDAEYTMLTFYHTSSFAPRYYNRAYYSNPQVDALIEQSLRVTSRIERDRIYAQVIRQVYQDAPVIMLFDLLQRIAVKEQVNGIYLERAGINWPAKHAWKAR
jgi:ABC-type transport system substrate-binding protein